MLLFILELIKYLKLNKPFTKGLPFLPSQKNEENKKRKYMKNIDYGDTDTLEYIPDNTKM